MNRSTTCRSGVGPEIILTPQDAGANPPHVSTPQEAIRRTRNNVPYSADITGTDEENTYEEFDDMYDEFNDQYEEYAEISDFERTEDSMKRKKKPSIKPKPKVNQNQHQPTTKPKEQTLSEEITNQFMRMKHLPNNSGNDTARSSTLEMTENDELYYNSGEVDQDYELAANVDDKYTENDEDENRYYDLQPIKKQMSTKYEQLRISDQYPDATQHRISQDIYDDDGEYYDDDEWSTEDSMEDYVGDEAVRRSVLAMQDGHGRRYSRKKSSTQC